MKEQVLVFIKSLIAGSGKSIRPVKNHPIAGCMKGTFSVGTDFNDPLEDFKEYME